MRGIRTNPSRRLRSASSIWLSTALGNIARFRRIAVWPDAPSMRLHLRQSPLHWMRERLWLLERLQPCVRMNLNVPIGVHAPSGTAESMSMRVIQRNSTFFSYLRGTELQLASPRTQTIRYEVAERSARPASASPISFAPAPPRELFRRETPQGDMSRRPSIEIPSIARLARRTLRVDELPVDLPVRLVRRSPAAPQAIAAHGLTEAPGLPANLGFLRASASPVWPAQPAPVAPVNVEQLTDQVLRQLDRRVIACRERMGRI